MFLFFGTLCEFLLAYCRIIFDGFVKTAFYVSRTLPRQFFLWKGWRFLLFSGVELKTFWSSVEKTSTGLSKLHSKCADNYFDDMKKNPKILKKDFLLLFWDIEWQISGFLSKTFWQGCHNCNLYVHRDFFMRLLVITKKSFFEQKPSWNNWAFCPKVLEAFVKIVFSASRKTLWGK